MKHRGGSRPSLQESFYLVTLPRGCKSAGVATLMILGVRCWWVSFLFASFSLSLGGVLFYQ